MHSARSYYSVVLLDGCRADSKNQYTVYRVFESNAEAGGAFVTSNPAINRVQTKVDSAILPEWKNSLKYEAEIVIPKVDCSENVIHGKLKNMISYAY